MLAWTRLASDLIYLTPAHLASYALLYGMISIMALPPPHQLPITPARPPARPLDGSKQFYERDILTQCYN